VHNEEGYYNIRFGLQDMRGSYCKMTVVRDPIMRLRSAWIDKVNAALPDFLSSRLGSPVALERENSRKDDTRDQSLTQAQVDKLLAITAADYALLGGLYDPEAALSRLDRTG